MPNIRISSCFSSAANAFPAKTLISRFGSAENCVNVLFRKPGVPSSVLVLTQERLEMLSVLNYSENRFIEIYQAPHSGTLYILEKATLLSLIEPKNTHIHLGKRYVRGLQ